ASATTSQVVATSGSTFVASTGYTTLKGTSGDDTFVGSSQADTFVFGANFGHDVIKDFVARGPAHDTIEFSKTVFDSFASVLSQPANLYRISLLHLSGLWAAGRQWADDAELRTPRLIGWAKRPVEALRQRIFAGRPRPAEDYDESLSEMSAFLRSCRRIFWAL